MKRFIVGVVMTAVFVGSGLMPRMVHTPNPKSVKATGDLHFELVTEKLKANELLGPCSEMDSYMIGFEEADPLPQGFHYEPSQAWDTGCGTQYCAFDIYVVSDYFGWQVYYYYNGIYSCSL